MRDTLKDPDNQGIPCYLELVQIATVHPAYRYAPEWY